MFSALFLIVIVVQLYRIDPYTVIRFGEHEVGRTPVRPKTLEPVWEYAVTPFVFDTIGDPPRDNASTPRCQVIVQDKDIMYDDLVGNGSFALVDCEVSDQNHMNHSSQSPHLLNPRYMYLCVHP
jgi:hypothetical protein